MQRNLVFWEEITGVVVDSDGGSKGIVGQVKEERP